MKTVGDFFDAINIPEKEKQEAMLEMIRYIRKNHMRKLQNNMSDNTLIVNITT